MTATKDAVAEVRALSKQATHCSEMCKKENRPECAAVCRDTAELADLVARFFERDAHATDAVADALIELAGACASECEQHDVQHCRDTAAAARAVVAVLADESATTPRTPSGERL